MVRSRYSPTMLLSAWCLRRAVRRWPPPLRDRLYKEWYAELHEVSTISGSAPLVIAYRRIRFAASLVCRAGVDELIEPRSWHSLLAGFRPHIRPVATLLAAPVLGYLVLMGLLVIPRFFTPTPHASVRMLCLAASVVAAGWAGVVLGRAHSIAAPTVLVPVLLAVGMFGAIPLLTTYSLRSLVYVLVGTSVWALLAITVGQHLRRPRPTWQTAVSATVAGAGIAYIAVTTAMLSSMVGLEVERQQLAGWFPANLIMWINPDAATFEYSSIAFELRVVANSLPLLLVLSTALGLAYAATSARSTPSTPAGSISSADSVTSASQESS
ncbi:MAG: hypothetical protein ACRDPW_07765 [Mycobacteriales bacterium]